MLPDIKKRRFLKGFDRMQYDSAQLHAVLDLKNHDGHTTKNGFAIIRRMNSYFEDSRRLIVEASVVFLFVKDLLDDNADYMDCEILQAYKNNFDKTLIGPTVKNMM